MFKKTLIAAALATMASGAFAAEVTDTKVTHTYEGAKSVTVIPAGDVIVTLGAEYKTGDVITLSFTQALDASYPIPTSLSSTGGTAQVVTIGLLDVSTDNKTLTYRVTALAATGTATVGEVLTWSGIKFNNDAKVAGSASVTYTAETDTKLPLDSSGTRTRTLVAFENQFSPEATTKFDGIVDVEAGRTMFVDATQIVDVEAGRTMFVDATQVDTLVVKVNDNNAEKGAKASIDANGVKYVVNGSWGFLDTDANNAGLQGGTVGVSAGSVAWAADKLTITAPDAVPVTLTVTTPAGVVIPVQTFTVDTEVKYQDSAAAAGTYTSTGLAAGEWKLNGASVEVPFMPYTEAFAQTIRIVNTGNSAGDVTVDAWNAAGEKKLANVKLGSIAAYQTFDAGKAVRALGTLVLNESYRFVFTVNVPKDDVQSSAAYRHIADSDRVSVPSQTK